MLLSALTTVFVAIHPNAGVHFNALGNVLKERSLPFVMYGADQAISRMPDHHPINFSEPCPLPVLDEKRLKDKAESLAHQIAEIVNINFVLVDVGAPFSLPLTNALKEKKIRVIAYVDNPDRFVPGYSSLAERIEKQAGEILYASANLSEREGIGYYPLEDEGALQLLRKNSGKRALFFERQNLDPQKPLLVFMGGANGAYVEALKSFVELNQGSFNHWNLLLHRHPRAPEEGLIDATLWNCLEGKISTASQNEAIAFADVIIYYQTTSALKGVLLGTPTLEWGGFKDGLVNELAVKTASTKEELEIFLKQLPVPDKLAGLRAVGYRDNWKARFLNHVVLSAQ